MITDILKNTGTRLGDDQKERMSHYLGFLIWPLGTAVAAFLKWDKPWSKNVFWLFCIFFGFTFIIQEGGATDSYRTAQSFIAYSMSDLPFSELWRSFYTEGSNYVDIIQPILIYLTSRFTGNTSILFMIFAIVFGFFYSRNLWYIIERVNGRFTGFVTLFLVTFAILNPISNINGFRMWTAAQVFFYGAIPYLLEGDKRKLIWSAMTVFIHFSFLLPVGVLFGFIFLGRRLNLFFLFFIFSAFIREIDLEWIRSIMLTYLPDFFDTQIRGYTNLRYAEELARHYQAYNWYALFDDVVLKWVIYAFVLYFFFTGKRILRERMDLNTLFCFSMLLYGFSNIFSNIPSGHRYLILSSVFMFAFFILYLVASPKTVWLESLQWISVPALMLVIIVQLRVGMEYYGFITLIGNPLIAAMNVEPAPLINEIKQLLLG